MYKHITASLVWRILGTVVSGVLLAISFPPFCESLSAWFALVPLFFVARSARGKHAFRWGFLCGMVFWLISLSWILSTRHTGGPIIIVALGWIALSAYCSVYLGVFLYIVCRLWVGLDGKQDSNTRTGLQAWMMRSLFWILVALAWVGVEYGRSVLFTGFPWNAMGISQYANLTLIQIASLGGVYAVSAVVVLMNGLVYATIARFVDMSVLRRPSEEPRFALTVGFAMLVAVVFFGTSVIKERDAQAAEGTSVRVAAIQPNIPQNDKWYEGNRDEIYSRLKRRTELAVMGRPDLVVWPETVLPGDFSEGYKPRAFVTHMSRLGVPILVGAIEEDVPEVMPDEDSGDACEPGKGGERCYNSSFLVDADDIVVGRYRKRHLVIVGEYIPFDKTIKWLQKLVPGGMTCTAGKESTIFRLEGDGGRTPFSVLICFEDAFAYLARDAVRSGARWLINQTNDAWFEGSQLPFQHMVHCVFRCVENGVPATRCGNTGVTCFIDSSGRIDTTTLSQLAKREYGATVYRSEIVRAPGEGVPPTFYTRYGDWLFAIPCGLFALIVLALQVAANLGLERARKKKDTVASQEVSNDRGI